MLVINCPLVRNQTSGLFTVLMLHQSMISERKLANVSSCTNHPERKLPQRR